MIEGLNLPERPFRGYYVNKDGGNASIDDLTLISHITDNLYVGGCLDGVDLGSFFTHIFSLYMWEKYASFDTKCHTVKMYDSRTEPIDVENVEGMSDEIVRALEEGGNVLVHCQAGINRSNLLAARSLMKWKGLSAVDAIALLREKRHRNVLANSTFENYLLGLDANG